MPASSFTALGRVLAVGTCCPGCLRLPLEQQWVAIGLLSALYGLLGLPLYVTVLNSEQKSRSALFAAASEFSVICHRLSVST